MLFVQRKDQGQYSLPDKNSAEPIPIRLEASGRLLQCERKSFIYG